MQTCQNTALVRWPPDGAQVRLEVLVGQVLETVEAPRRCPGLDEEVGRARRDGLVQDQPGWRPAAGGLARRTPPRCHNRRSAGCTPMAFPVGCCLGRRGG